MSGSVCGMRLIGDEGKATGARMNERGKISKRMKREVLYGADNADYGAGAGGGG